MTNDDGIDSAGLHALARLALEVGLDVLVAAPARESSGASASLGAVEVDGQIVVDQVELAGLAAARTLAVRAAPAFIVRAATHGIFGPKPDIVLSGINPGQNTGHAVLHSGTVGAALTAAMYGCPAVAISLASGRGEWLWETAVVHARPVLEWMLATNPPNVVINLNVPNVTAEHVRGRRPAPLARFGVVQAKVTASGHGYVQLEYNDVDPVKEPESDAGLLADGWATLTGLRPLSAATDIDLAAISLT